MPVPFRDLRNEDALGLIGYLRFVGEENRRGIRGALFLINARGEPVDFAYSRIDVHASFLWRDGEAKRYAVASLTNVLFQACPKTPSLLMALADEVHPKLFTEDIHADVPICRVAGGADVERGPGEWPESLSDSIHLFWAGTAPERDSSAHRLLDLLIARQLIMEPFERLAIGIGEAFREQ